MGVLLPTAAKNAEWHPVAPLGVHPFTLLPLTSDGWTDLEAMVSAEDEYNDTRIIYVSTSGSDTPTTAYYSIGDAEIGDNPFNPTGEPEAYLTINEAYAQLRTGYADIMLLKRGDEWAENTDSWRKSGKSQTERMIFGAYGDESEPRPIMGCIEGHYSNQLEFLLFVDLEVGGIDTKEGISLYNPMNHVLVEGVLCAQGYKSGLVFQNGYGDGDVDYLALRRCVVYDRHRPAGSTGYCQGMYIDDAINLLVEENVFDNNGKLEDGSYYSTGDLRAHNTYVMLGRTGTGTHIWRYNITTRACANGLLAGSGGEVYGNLVAANPIGILASKPESWDLNGFPAHIYKNAIIHGCDISPDDRRGWGMYIENTNNSVIEDNIIGLNDSSGQAYGIIVNASTQNSTQTYIQGLDIDNNIIDNWNGEDGNVIDGKAISISRPDYSDAITYTYGEDPSDYITDVRITNNDINLANDELRLLQIPSAGVVVESSGNKYYGTRESDQLFRVTEIGGMTLDSYNALVSDTTSTLSTTSPVIVPDYDYGLEDYQLSIGDVETRESFYTATRLQRKGNWETKYTAIPVVNFTRTAFNRDSLAIDYTLPE